ncbi:baculoviral IAP repeat-containing protein 7-A-like [Nasonia vitripennis]|uniref:Uncharacterized protein n=1 Tax=Nasonia vitripennis TaxID=7425 RepID=A0A7M7T969_NASVI|nr:baculoviral IAP repeat-containing protein 7-A-like [Nasonia vitripennis]
MAICDTSARDQALIRTLLSISEQSSGPKHPEYIAYNDRLYTLILWLEGLSQKPEILAEMGLCYNYYENQVYCFYCDCKMSRLQHGEDLWIIHAILAPYYNYLRTRKGEEFIEKVYTSVNFNRKPPPKSLHCHDQYSSSDKSDIVVMKPLDCKICFRKEGKILFLPCSHLIDCAECAIKLEECCIC